MINEETLKQITEFAKLQFTSKEIEIIIGLPVDSLKKQMENVGGKSYLAYQKGILLAESEVRKSIYQSAKQGSTPSQKTFLKLIEDRIKKENKDEYPV